mgnify:FL=1
MENKILGLIGLSAKSGRIAFGADSVKREIVRGRIRLLILAENSSEKTKLKFKKIADEAKVPTIFFGTISNLSTAIGKTNKAILGITDMNFAREIKRIVYSGGDSIG